jgi:hypothetical protein
VLFGVFIISVIIREIIPPYVINNSPHDDLLGVQLAKNIIIGNWLGTWSINTLAKPPGYSIFLSISHNLYISPTLLTHLIYLITSLLFSYFILMIVSKNSKHISSMCSKNIGRIIFIVLAFNPVMFSGNFSRVYRTSLYSVFTMMFFTLLILMFLLVLEEFKKIKENKKISVQVKWLAFLLGLVYFILQTVRAETFWILYALATAGIPFVIFGIFVSIRERKGLNLLKLVLIICVCFSVPVAFGNLVIETTNWKNYGVLESENFYSGSFSEAYKKWSGVREGMDTRSFVGISKGQRAAVYKISLSAQKLSPYLEVPDGTGWKIHSCEVIGLCDDYGGAWLPWAIRDAAIASGQVTDERTFQDFFQRISNDIHIACLTKKISCTDPGFQVGIKPLPQIPIRYIANSMLDSTSRILQLSSVEYLDRPITNQDNQLFQIWSDVVKIKYEPTNNSNQWLSLPSLVELLKIIYQPFILIGSLFSLQFLGSGRRKAEDLSLKVYVYFLFIAVYTYIAGLGLTEASYGFSNFKNLQLITVQPLFLMAVITACVGVYVNFLKKKPHL